MQLLHLSDFQIPCKQPSYSKLFPSLERPWTFLLTVHRSIAVARVAARTVQIRNVRQEAIVAGLPVPGRLRNVRIRTPPLLNRSAALAAKRRRQREHRWQIQHAFHDVIRMGQSAHVRQALVVHQPKILRQRKPNGGSKPWLKATLMMVTNGRQNKMADEWGQHRRDGDQFRTEDQLFNG